MGEAPLEPGDALFIFTDGLVEAENEHGVEYGENSLPTFMKASANASAQDALQFLMADVNRFVGQARQHDDITCLLAKLQ
jgi:sigma-B regulation protein RsbU (phosphoserine phosphatase)